jgi:hypothetical protein
MPDFKDYLARIEEVFIALRGTPFVLSPADVQLVRSWHGRGLPAELVEEAVREVFERERYKNPARRIGGLGYCAYRVEEAWADRGRRRAGSWQREGEPLPLAELLEANRARLRAFFAAAPFPDPGGKLASRLSARLEKLGKGDPDPGAVEEGLKKAQDALTLAALRSLPEGEREAMEAAIRATLEKELAPLPTPAARLLVKTLLLDRVRERFGIPTLTLL